MPPFTSRSQYVSFTRRNAFGTSFVIRTTTPSTCPVATRVPACRHSLKSSDISTTYSRPEDTPVTSIHTCTLFVMPTPKSLTFGNPKGTNVKSP